MVLSSKGTYFFVAPGMSNSGLRYLKLAVLDVHFWSRETSKNFSNISSPANVPRVNAPRDTDINVIHVMSMKIKIERKV